MRSSKCKINGFFLLLTILDCSIDGVVLLVHLLICIFLFHFEIIKQRLVVCQGVHPLILIDGGLSHNGVSLVGGIYCLSKADLLHIHS